MDEKGYVLSGLGFLLLIPIMILIPIALSLEVQSNNLPENFVKSDTIFQTYKNIQADINSKVNQFISAPSNQNSYYGIYGVTYSYLDSNKLAGNISYLYNSTRLSDYQNSFVNTVDYLNIQPAFSDHQITGDNITGTIPLNNGIEMNYGFVNQSVDKKNYILYNYEMNVTINMTITIKKDTNGFNQNFVLVYPVTNAFYINSTTTDPVQAITNVKIFFTDLKTNPNLVGTIN